MDAARPETDARGSLRDLLAAAPVLMLESERLLLYALVFALRPARILEIGTHQGGSALIMAAALDAIGAGAIVCVDPEPAVADATWQRIAHRATLVVGASPEVLVDAGAAAGAPFDLALIDGDHGYAGVVRDLEGVLPLMAPHSYLLFHDAHFREIRSAIDDSVLAHPDELVDCGMLSVDENVEVPGEVVWGGFRLLRHRGAARAVAANGAPAPASVGAIAQVLRETTGLGGAAAARAARGLADRAAYPIDYVAECRTLWGASDRDFIAGLSRVLFARTPSSVEADPYWGMLATGATRLDVVRALAFSDEARGRGVPTEWVDALIEASGLFPAGRTGAVRRRVASWVRTQPRLAQLARYALAALRLPWRSERTWAAGLEHQRQLAELRTELRHLAAEVRALRASHGTSADTRR